MLALELFEREHPLAILGTAHNVIVEGDHQVSALLHFFLSLGELPTEEVNRRLLTVIEENGLGSLRQLACREVCLIASKNLTACESILVSLISQIALKKRFCEIILVNFIG